MFISFCSSQEIQNDNNKFYIGDLKKKIDSLFSIEKSLEEEPSNEISLSLEEKRIQEETAESNFLKELDRLIQEIEEKWDLFSLQLDKDEINNLKKEVFLESAKERLTNSKLSGKKISEEAEQLKLLLENHKKFDEFKEDLIKNMEEKAGGRNEKILNSPYCIDIYSQSN